jgi:hypothetical protein
MVCVDGGSEPGVDGAIMRYGFFVEIFGVLISTKKGLINKDLIDQSFVHHISCLQIFY